MEAIPSKVAIERWFVKTVGFICLMACLIGGSCTPSMPPECQEFFYSGSSNDAEKEFSSYDLDKQLKIYRCGMTRRPPHTTLALLIADRGEDAVSPLLDKLETERDELSQYSIIRILAVMSLKGHLRNRSDVADRVRQVIARMTIPTFREMAKEELNTIEQNSDITGQ